jgi:hypothetical protein
MGYHIIPVRMVTTKKKNDNDKCWQRSGIKSYLYTVSGNINYYCHSGK